MSLCLSDKDVYTSSVLACILQHAEKQSAESRMTSVGELGESIFLKKVTQCPIVLVLRENNKLFTTSSL